MDFSVVERHPWATTGIVVVGGVVLFSLMRRGGSSASGGITTVNPGVSDAQVAADAQAKQVDASLAAVQIQGSYALQGAVIQADVQKFSIAAQQNVTNNQTAAQVSLGTSTLAAQLGLAQIDAGVQKSWIEALVSSLKGGATQSPTPIPIANPTTNQTVTLSNPTITPAYPVSIPDYQTLPYKIPPGDGIVPGGQQLVPYPNLIPQGAWPDSSVVASNVAAVVDWQNQTLAANAANNRRQCLANAEMSKGFANYGSLVAACG